MELIYTKQKDGCIMEEHFQIKAQLVINKYYKTGTLKSQEWYTDNLLHRNDDLPSIVKYWDNKIVQREEWCQNNQLYRQGNLPVVIEYHQNGSIKSQEWIHTINFDSPQFIEYWETGVLKCQKFIDTDGNEITNEYFENGQMKKQEWSKNGRTHRDDNLPAFIEWDSDGNLLLEQWFINGEKNNNIGPDNIYYYSNGHIKQKVWFSRLFKNTGLPFMKVYWETGIVKQIQYSPFDTSFDTNNPTTIDFWNDGSIQRKEWKCNNNIKLIEYYENKQLKIALDLITVSSTEPILLEYYQDGQIKKEYWSNPGTVTTLDLDLLSTNKWWKNKKLHCDFDLPAEKYYYENGQLKRQVWFKNGKHHRENLPAVIVYWSNGVIRKQVWRMNNKTMRPTEPDLPAVIKYYDTGTLQIQQWYKDEKLYCQKEYYPMGNIKRQTFFNGQHCNDNLPASVDYWETGRVKKKMWFVNSKLNRIGKPAIIEYWDTGILKFELWFCNDLFYRENDQPCIKEYFPNGDLKLTLWHTLEHKYGKNELSSQIQNVYEQTEEMCLHVVKKDGLLLKHIKNQTDNIKRTALENNSHAFKYIHEQSYDDCTQAFSKNGLLLKLLHEKHFYTIKILKQAVEQNGMALKYIPFKYQTPEVCLTAIRNNIKAIRFSKYKDLNKLQ